MNRSLLLKIAAAASLSVVVGCSPLPDCATDSATCNPPLDAGTQGHDAGNGADSGQPDAGNSNQTGAPDAGDADAGDDAGMDAGVDGGDDAGTDAGIDAGTAITYPSYFACVLMPSSPAPAITVGIQKLLSPTDCTVIGVISMPLITNVVVTPSKWGVRSIPYLKNTAAGHCKYGASVFAEAGHTEGSVELFFSPDGGVYTLSTGAPLPLPFEASAHVTATYDAGLPQVRYDVDHLPVAQMCP